MRDVIGVRWGAQQAHAVNAVRVGPVRFTRSDFDWYDEIPVGIDPRAVLAACRFRGREGDRP
jgi:hypothetical protein